VEEVTMTAAPEHATTRQPAQPGQKLDGLTVEELSQLVGMSPRNIRSHQARKLLPPPVRKGRIALYDESHVRRLKTIIALQRQGFNLVSIEAILGTRNSDPGASALTATLHRLTADKPSLVYALGRHNVVARTENGEVHLARPGVIRIALQLHRVGLGGVAALQILGELLDHLQLVTEELTQECSARVLALVPEPDGSGPRSWEDLDRDTVALTQGIIDLLSASFRVAVENCSETIVAELVSRRYGVDLKMDVDPTQQLDNG
jgi:DNA-binding transcriptional MerR regulator